MLMLRVIKRKDCRCRRNELTKRGLSPWEPTTTCQLLRADIANSEGAHPCPLTTLASAPRIPPKTVLIWIRQKRLTPYERVTAELNNDRTALKEITLGKRIGFYRIRNELGTGNFSQVKMGLHVLTKEKVAIKMLDKTKLDQKTQRLLSREISCMERLHHPNIIRLYEVIETLAKLHLVMEYAGGGELFTKITNEGKIPEPESKMIFTQIVSAVNHMHSNHIIHRDLKAENIFYTASGLVKVGDFGFSTYCKTDEHLNTFCGSPPYAAPELFKDEHYLGMPVDIWAMGIMLYFMVTGVMPFRADTVAKLKKCIIDGQFTVPNHVSGPCQELVTGMLQLSPTDRLLAEQLTQASWLTGQEFPPAHRSYHLTPSFSRDSATEEELTVLDQLTKLGIQEEQLAATKEQKIQGTVSRHVPDHITPVSEEGDRGLDTSRHRGPADGEPGHTHQEKGEKEQIKECLGLEQTI
ncbi:putative serine/threonine-protein kinase NIM1 [Apostichopus japonicus]|uniref:Serine/threonine-protein kinase NIM1 n=1 Tax=Stichopus japonicus TaxID=307972 RepID=A0A2G8LHS3_STIJA|nr:putative serine/threonine-protein kinase NIM1 [Apostichopus japonicus]